MSGNSEIRVLLLSPDPLVLRSLRGFLQLNGYLCHTSLRISDALQIAEREYFDVCVIDCDVLPGDDNSHHRIRTELTTGLASSTSPQWFVFLMNENAPISTDFESGNATLPKPVDAVRLLLLLQKIRPGQHSQPVTERFQFREMVGESLRVTIMRDFQTIASEAVGFDELGILELFSRHPFTENLAKLFRIEADSHKPGQLLGTGIRIPFLSLETVVRETSRLLRAFLPASRDLRVELHPYASTIYVDPVQLGQIVLSLGINSFYRLRGMRSGRMTLRTEDFRLDEWEGRRSRLEAGHYLALSWEDSVPHARERDMRMLLNPYASVRVVQSEEEMGLFLLKIVVHRLQGRILFRSLDGRGRLFRVFLPQSTLDTVTSPDERIGELQESDNPNVRRLHYHKR